MSYIFLQLFIFFDNCIFLYNWFNDYFVDAYGHSQTYNSVPVNTDKFFERSGNEVERIVPFPYMTLVDIDIANEVI